MNRADARLAFVIVSTAIVASVVTVVVSRVIAEPATNGAAVQAVEQRVTALEVRAALTERPVAEAPVAPVVAEAAPAEAPPADDVCDEVSCVLNDYEPPCCKRFRRTQESLDRAAITVAIDAVKPRIGACADRDLAKGMVKVSVKVTPGGSVASVTVRAAPTPALGECVRAAILTARFVSTRYGGSFSYPFVF